jgi:glucosylglycerate synthase
MSDKQYNVVRPHRTTNLDAQVQLNLAQVGAIDLVIGIPSHRNGRTIGDVLYAVNKGISDYYPGQRVLLLDMDGGSSDNTTALVLETSMPSNVVTIVAAYAGPPGKGSAIRAIFEAAGIVRARACLVLDAHVPGINSDWLPGLVEPVLTDSFELCLGAYCRSSFAAAFNDNVVYPFLYAFLNSGLRNPSATELCVSGEYAADLAAQDVWETDVARFGVNVWIAMASLLTQRRMVQVELGFRGDPSGDPGAMADPRLLHVLSSLFRFLTTHHRLWSMPMPLLHVPLIPANRNENLINCSEYIAPLMAAFKAGVRTYRREWAQVLTTKDIAIIQQLIELPIGSCVFPLDLWTRLMLRFAFVYNCGEGDPDKILEAFLPLYYGRAAAYIRQTADCTQSEREPQVEQITAAMVEAKSAFVAVWRDRPIWMDPSWF